jgi:hypothetical protein
MKRNIFPIRQIGTGAAIFCSTEVELPLDHVPANDGTGSGGPVSL